MALTKKKQKSELDILNETGRRKAKKERRDVEAPVVGERRGKIQRRRQIDPTTCERDYNEEELAFMRALDEYKRRNGRMFPTCSEILEVVKELGYRLPGQVDVAPIADLSADTSAMTTAAL